MCAYCADQKLAQKPKDTWSREDLEALERTKCRDPACKFCIRMFRYPTRLDYACSGCREANTCPTCKLLTCGKDWCRDCFKYQQKLALLTGMLPRNTLPAQTFLLTQNPLTIGADREFTALLKQMDTAELMQLDLVPVFSRHDALTPFLFMNLIFDHLMHISFNDWGKALKAIFSQRVIAAMRDKWVPIAGVLYTQLDHMLRDYIEDVFEAGRRTGLIALIDSSYGSGMVKWHGSSLLERRLIRQIAQFIPSTVEKCVYTMTN